MTSFREDGTHIRIRWGAGETVFMMVFYPYGSRNETKTYRGGMHVLEHMVFQGVNTDGMRTWDEITETFEPLGTVNAMTTQAIVGYWCHVSADKTKEAATALGHLACSTPLLPAGNVKEEIKVVIRELEESENNPDRKVAEEANVTLYGPDDPKGWSIGATKEQVETLDTGKLMKLYNASHRKPRAIVLGKDPASKIAHEALCAAVEECLKKKSNEEKCECSVVREDEVSTFKDASTTFIEKDTKGFPVVVSFALERCALGSEEYYTACIAASILGGRMGSRLTNALRKKGMVYSVQASVDADASQGTLQISTSVNDKAGLDEMLRLIKNAPTKVEVGATIGWYTTQRCIAEATSPMSVANEAVDFLRYRKETVRKHGYSWGDESIKYKDVTFDKVAAFWNDYMVKTPYTTYAGKEKIV